MLYNIMCSFFDIDIDKILSKDLYYSIKQKTSKNMNLAKLTSRLIILFLIISTFLLTQNKIELATISIFFSFIGVFMLLLLFLNIYLK